MTSKLLDKSKENISSADLLIGNNFFSSSVHCSYYSCIQIMSHVLRSDLNKSEDEIKKEREMGSSEFHGFHNWMQNYLFREVSKKYYEDARIAFEFNNLLGSLKGIRVRSDYGISNIAQKEAEKALAHANRINKIITERFKI